MGTVLTVSIANIAVLYLTSSTVLMGILMHHEDKTNEEANRFSIGHCNVDLFDIVRNGTILWDGEVVRNERQRVHEQVHRHIESTVIEYQQRPLGVLLHSHDATYYHALVEFGSRLQFTLNNCPSPQISWVIRASPSQIKLLELLHSPPILNFINHEPGINYSSQIVLIPPPPYRIEDLFTLRANLMRRALPALGPLAQPAAHPPRSTILFVQRVYRRAIENEDTILGIFLASFPGNLVVFPETPDLPLAENMAFFHSADIVLGGHGAGLANIIFCRPARSVFEIRRPGTPSEFVAQLAAFAQLAHFAYVDPDLLPHRRGLHYRNYTVSPTAFRAFVRAAAASPHFNHTRPPPPAPATSPPARPRQRAAKPAGKPRRLHPPTHQAAAAAAGRGER